MKKTLGVLCVVAVVLGVAGQAVAGPPKQGGGCFDFPSSLVPTPGEQGRSVFLQGTIVGENFEPGICIPFPGEFEYPTNLFGGKCAIFTKNAQNPGDFQRLHQGQTAFTYCRDCVVDGRQGDFTLKISYPNPKSFTDPTASPFTKFTIQNATGELAGLKGQGTLDFTNGCYTMNYQFTR